MLLWTHAAALVVSLTVGTTKGSGTIKEETRQVGNFSGVSVSTGLRATVTIGPKTSVVVRGDDNLLPMIKVEVVNGRLTAEINSVSGGIHPTEPIRLTIVTPNLTSAEASSGASLTADATPSPKFVASSSSGGKVSVKGIDSKELRASASGGGTITATGVKADSAEIEGSGGSTISLSGKVKRLQTSLSGGAGLKAQDVPAEALKVQASGGSRVYAQVSSELSAKLSGGATVYLKGKPSKRDVDTSGGSKIYYE
jgi:Putative auto-transporter adhesin, head GIN domain